jgi:hypothetical protein
MYSTKFSFNSLVTKGSSYLRKLHAWQSCSKFSAFMVLKLVALVDTNSLK